MCKDFFFFATSFIQMFLIMKQFIQCHTVTGKSTERSAVHFLSSNQTFLWLSFAFHSRIYKVKMRTLSKGTCLSIHLDLRQVFSLISWK